MEWICIRDRLPDNHDVVLVSDGHNITVAQAYYNVNDDFSWQIKKNKSDLWSDDGYEIKYWSNLPNPPEGD